MSFSESLNYLTSRFLLEGALLAIEIAVVAMLGGLALGLVIALLRLSPVRLLNAVAWFYIWFLRGTPVLLQLVFLYDALPAVGIVMSPVTTAMLGFALNEAAENEGRSFVTGRSCSIHFFRPPFSRTTLSTP